MLQFFAFIMAAIVPAVAVYAVMEFADSFWELELPSELSLFFGIGALAASLITAFTFWSDFGHQYGMLEILVDMVTVPVGLFIITAGVIGLYLKIKTWAAQLREARIDRAFNRDTE